MEICLADAEAKNKEKKKEAKARLTSIPPKHGKNICNCNAIKERNKGTRKRIPQKGLDATGIWEDGSAAALLPERELPRQKGPGGMTGINQEKYEAFPGL